MSITALKPFADMRQHRRGKVAGCSAQQNVDVAKLVMGLLQGCVDGRIVANVQGWRSRPCLQPHSNRIYGGIQLFLFASGQHDFCAMFREAFGHPQADAAAASRDEGDLSLEEPLPKDARHGRYAGYQPEYQKQGTLSQGGITGMKIITTVCALALFTMSLQARADFSYTTTTKNTRGRHRRRNRKPDGKVLPEGPEDEGGPRRHVDDHGLRCGNHHCYR